MSSLTIGKVARRAGIGIETIRFYEREGLIEEPARKESGYRQFDEEVIRRLQFIRHAKELGFTLSEIKELLSLKLDPTTSCADIKGRTEAKIADVQSKIISLQRMREALQNLANACQGTGRTSECPILDALEGEGAE